MSNLKEQIIEYAESEGYEFANDLHNVIQYDLKTKSENGHGFHRVIEVSQNQEDDGHWKTRYAIYWRNKYFDSDELSDTYLEEERYYKSLDSYKEMQERLEKAWETLKPDSTFNFRGDDG